ncbi:hypothetical protein UK12_28080 [Saccharothrix sp. ST-888]|nr:hypothetical protein UK12_28080 [Saccharothrix sp. ST-888]
MYPVSVKTFAVRTDTVDTVFASNVNDVQNEIQAVEQTLGVSPHVWAGAPVGRPLSALATTTPFQAATYTSVGARLDAVQTQVAALTQIANQQLYPVNAPQQPAATIQCTGQMTTPGVGAWQPFLWSGTSYDPAGMYQGGADVLCPQSGWYQVSVSVWVPVAQVVGLHHANARVLVSGAEVATGASHAQPGTVDTHRVSVSWGGPWRAGQTLQVQVSHAPADANNTQLLALATLSLSYQRSIS